MTELEQLKSEGWIEYEPQLNFVVLNEDGKEVEQLKITHLYKIVGKICTMRCIVPPMPLSFTITPPFK